MLFLGLLLSFKLRVELLLIYVSFVPEVLSLEVDPCLKLLFLNELRESLFIHVSHELVEHVWLKESHVLKELRKLVNGDFNEVSIHP